ncbi:MAG: hypothetical protein U9P79_06030 [Candidatus Cloacimonadota bacterium]|nr:hypothetical protein [Candidatus Cloacimonadota bacterium]
MKQQFEKINSELSRLKTCPPPKKLPDKFSEMVRNIRECESAMGKVNYELSNKVKEHRAFRRSIFASENIKAGEQFNYFYNKVVGKEAHLARCKASNFLINQDLDAYIGLRESYANLSYGRDIIMIVKLRSK